MKRNKDRAPESRPRVLLIGPDPSQPGRQGGVAAHMRYLMQSPLAPRLIPAFTDSSRIHRLPLPSWAAKMLSLLALFLRLVVRRQAGGSRAHVNSSLYPRAVPRDLLILLALSLRGVPALVQYHGGRIANLRRRGLPFRIWIWSMKRLCSRIA
ncbi:MAG TPA: hypothetical protein VLV83_07505, partial [Acidobacteriota bacterium]|nr:hypothetical protein [Acidobacteriota bacterium]